MSFDAEQPKVTPVEESEDKHLNKSLHLHHSVGAEEAQYWDQSGQFYVLIAGVQIRASGSTGIPYPRTLEGLFSLLEKPLHTWYPLAIPKEFDSEYGFIYDKALSEEASQYFYEQLIKRGQLPEFASVKVQQLALENFLFQRLLERLQEANENDAERALQEYVLLRRFLIENPYTTLESLRKTFSKTRYISINDVGELYEDCKENESYSCCDR